MLKAKDIMKKDVVTVMPNDSVKKAIKELVDKKASMVLVKDTEGNLVGIVTEYDLILAISTVGYGLDVANIMKKEFVSVKIGTTVEEIAEIFLTKRVKTLPVVDEKDKLAGVLSRRDVLIELYSEG